MEIRDGGSVDGDIVSPRVAIAEGAHFRGSVDMQRKPGQQGQGAQQQRPASQGGAQQQRSQPRRSLSRSRANICDTWL